MLVACVSPAIQCLAETISTLQFANRCKAIKNTVKINRDTIGNVQALQKVGDAHWWIQIGLHSCRKKDSITKTIEVLPVFFEPEWIPRYKQAYNPHWFHWCFWNRKDAYSFTRKFSDSRPNWTLHKADTRTQTNKWVPWPSENNESTF